MNNAQAILASLSKLSTVYRQPLNDLELEIYLQVLEPYGSVAVAAACESLLADPDAPGWFPRTQELVLRITGSKKRQAISAWHKFRTGISQYAGFTVAFDDPLIHVVAQRVGGWSKLGLSNSYALDKMRDDFVELYGQALQDAPVPAEIPRRLLGDDTPPAGKAIPIGDRSKVEQVLRGDMAVALAGVTHLPAMPSGPSRLEHHT